MPKQKKNIALDLNEEVISLMGALTNHYRDDPELPEKIRDLTRVSKFLVIKSLIKVDYE